MTLIRTSLLQYQSSVICIMVMILWWRMYQILHILTLHTTRYNLILVYYLCRWPPCSVLCLRCRARANSSPCHKHHWPALMPIRAEESYLHAHSRWFIIRHLFPDRSLVPHFMQITSRKSSICTLCLSRKNPASSETPPTTIANFNLHELNLFSVMITC